MFIKLFSYSIIVYFLIASAYETISNDVAILLFFFSQNLLEARDFSGRPNAVARVIILIIIIIIWLGEKYEVVKTCAFHAVTSHSSWNVLRTGGKTYKYRGRAICKENTR